MAKMMRIPLRVVFYKEGDRYMAHCLEFDLIGDGTTRNQALAMLAQAILIQIQCSVEHNNPRNLFSPADGKYFRMFFAGKDVDVAAGELSIHIDDVVVIEDVEYREYEYGGDFALA